jgi:tRNA(adenine34) deaminase
MFSEQDEQWMRRALAQAEKAAACREVPVGAVLVAGGEVLAESFNQPISLNDPSAHAEILALRKAAAIEKNYRLPEAELFVTIEPCLMCAGALVHARVKRLVFGAREPKAGAVCSHLQVYEQGQFNHTVKVEEGLLAQECSELMSDFFKARRN